MKNLALFRFYAELNDFLPIAKKQKTIGYSFFGSPSVKDAIEALGVPHPEVDLILVNGNPVSFSYKIQNNDSISVYPEFELLDISSVSRLRPQPLWEPKFSVDVNLGRLARKLRLLGFDASYSNTYTPKELIRQAVNEKRILLTKSAGLLKNKNITRGYWVRATDVFEQTKEVVTKFDLFGLIKLLHSKVLMVQEFHPVAKEEVVAQIPERTKRYFNKFYRCEGCARIYWKGTHYQKMVRFIERLSKQRINTI